MLRVVCDRCGAELRDRPVDAERYAMEVYVDGEDEPVAAFEDLCDLCRRELLEALSPSPSPTPPPPTAPDRAESAAPSPSGEAARGPLSAPDARTVVPGTSTPGEGVTPATGPLGGPDGPSRAPDPVPVEGTGRVVSRRPVRRGGRG